MKTRVQASAWYILIHNGIQKWGVAHDRDYIGVPKPVAIMSLLKWQASAYLVSADSSVWSIPPLACLSRDDWPSCMMVLIGHYIRAYDSSRCSKTWQQLLCGANCPYKLNQTHQNQEDFPHTCPQ